MELYARVRRAVVVDKMSEREAAQEFGLARETVRKMLRYAGPPGYPRQQPACGPRLDAWVGAIDRILEDDKARGKKQRQTAKRIFERLRDEHIRHNYSGNNIGYCGQAIRVLYGLPDIGNNHFQTNKVCVQALASPIRIHDNDSENYGKFFKGEGDTVIIESNRIAACRPPAGQGCIQTAGALISRGNLFNALVVLSVRGEGYELGFGISVMGGNQGGSATVFDCNRGNNGLEALNVIVLCANGYINKLQVSENGYAFQNVIP